MKIYKIDDMKQGWFIGNFEPTAYSTARFEVCYRTHKKGEKWEWHYHKTTTEINLITSGRMIMQGRTLLLGDIFIIEPYEISDQEFLEDTTIVCVRTGLGRFDKFIIEEKC